MIPYESSRQQVIPNSSVKVIGVGGAGANMLDRIALDGMDGAELLAANTDVRTLTASVAPEKVQLGRNLTKGLGSGGDPELGKKAAAEAELELRDSLRDRKIVFICVGLGGGTGSGAAPLITRLAREEGAFTVVFATMPFPFEGSRRREQAETALNELAVLANALVTFDNGRMGELILAKQGVHEAFSAADRMVSESIKAVTRIVMRPGLINIGLDDLVAALKTNRSRCLFGSGIASGENRALQALKNAMSSPLLDRGSLLNHAETVLVHLCGGEDMTLYEIELLMQGLSKHVPDSAQILFGTGVDPAMGDSLSVTLVSSLPEDRLHSSMGPEASEMAAASIPSLGSGPEAPAEEPSIDPAEDYAAKPPAPDLKPEPEPEAQAEPEPEPEAQAEPAPEDPPAEESAPAAEASKAPLPTIKQPLPLEEPADETSDEPESAPEPPAAEEPPKKPRRIKLPPKRATKPPSNATAESIAPVEDDADGGAVRLATGQGEIHAPEEDEADKTVDFEAVKPQGRESASSSSTVEELRASAKARSKSKEDELALEGGPKGRFEGQDPNLVEGEDLDIPPFLRQKKG